VRGNAWRPPPRAVPHTAFRVLNNLDAASLAETWYAEAVRLEAEGSASAVDAYLQTAAAAWPAVEALATAVQRHAPMGTSSVTASLPESRDWKLYQSAVAGLLESAQRFGRWSPSTGLLVMGPQGLQPVATSYHGFVWAPAEFGELHPIGDDTVTHLKHDYRHAGLGVPLVVVRNDAGAPRPFVQPGRQFAATALVRPVLTAAGPSVRLEFYDPLRQSHVRLSGALAPLASDISAPLRRSATNFRKRWLDPFLNPSAGGDHDVLAMIEPYQSGKIPVLLIHGLLSDPLTWNDMINELQAQPQIVSRYQIWTFGYDTGAPFLTGAAALRRQLAALEAYYTPYGHDAASGNIVAVGHSMGGLVANLQVTYSTDQLWNAAARVPLESLFTDPATRAVLGEAFFFEPSESISRVIYIGTPHQGSGIASRGIGSLGAALVTPAPITEARHAQIVRDNPEVFSDEFADRFPTSVDLLEPSSPLLNATGRLPYRPGVVAHSIIGDGQYTVAGDPSDGVVPVSSARLQGASSELLVNVRHAQEPRNEQVVAEVMRILLEHARAASQSF
jgi:hypothetical protein